MARAKNVRTFTKPERAAIGELFEMADAFNASTKPEVQMMAMLVLERIRRIVEGECPVLVYTPGQADAAYQVIAEMRNHLPSAPLVQ